LIREEEEERDAIDTKIPPFEFIAYNDFLISLEHLSNAVRKSSADANPALYHAKKCLRTSSSN
jgi:hypothetical protein